VSIDSFFYYGTDEQYLNYIGRFLKPDGPLGIAGAGLMREIEGSVPDHLREWWTADLWGLHSADWWRRHLGSNPHSERRVDGHATQWLAVLARLAPIDRP